ncbi:MAG: flagellar biosynthesis anti-sigma factor FlgM [Treponema sp.]|jgi:negative regulator of flagellin synthesis FlgM|nr:flagellar biosynthesis anti-sigma factor FlgM [Treponema sp.]
MMIDKISGVQALNQLQSTKRSNNVASSQTTSDEISVSDEAKAMAETLYLNKVADETPDVRADLVEKIKLKIQDPNYLNEATIAATADRILSAYGL